MKLMIVFAKAPFCKLCHRENLEKLPLTAGKVGNLFHCVASLPAPAMYKISKTYIFFLLGLYKTGLVWQ